MLGIGVIGVGMLIEGASDRAHAAKLHGAQNAQDSHLHEH
jgi:hypothetical protein